MARHPVPIQLVDVFGSALENGAITVVEHGTDTPVILHDANIGGSVITQPAMTNRYGELEVWTDFVGLIDVIYEETDETTDARDRRRRFDTQTKTWEVGLASGAGFEQLQADSQTPYFMSWDTPFATIYTSTTHVSVIDHGTPTEPLSPLIPLGALPDPYVIPPTGTANTGPPYNYTAQFRFAREGLYRFSSSYRFLPGVFDWSKIGAVLSFYAAVGDPPADGFSQWLPEGVTWPFNVSITPWFTRIAVGLNIDLAVVDIDPEDVAPGYPTWPYGLAMDACVIPVGWDVFAGMGLESSTAQFSAPSTPTMSEAVFRIFRLA